jgi:hypothetical protein
MYIDLPPESTEIVKGLARDTGLPCGLVTNVAIATGLRSLRPETPESISLALEAQPLSTEQERLLKMCLAARQL